MKKYLKVVLSLLIVFILIASVGCSQADKGSSSGGDKYYIGFIQGGSEYYNSTQANAVQYACEQLGWDIVILNSEYVPEKEISNAEDLIQKNVDAIMMFTVNAESGQKVAQMCNEADIPLFMIDGGAAEGPGKPVTYSSYDFYYFGQAIGEYVSVNFPNSKMVYITGMLGAGIIEGQTQGLHDELAKQNKGIEIVFDQPADWDRAKAMDVMENVIAAGIDFDIIFVNNEDMASGVIKVLKDHNLLEKTPVFATGGSIDGIEMIKNGELNMTVAASPALQACSVVKAMKDYFNGETIPERLISPIYVITKDNLDEAVSFEISDNVVKISGLLD